MNTTPAPEVLDHLAHTLDALEQARAREDRAEEWRSSFLALALLHGLHDVAQARVVPPKDSVPKAKYKAALTAWRTLLEATEDGATLAALTFVRGFVHHSFAIVRHQRWEVIVTDEASPRPATLPVTTPSGKTLDAPLEILTAILWPPRADLPPSTQPSAKGDTRPGLYDLHVAEKPLMEPLRAAQRFVVGHFTPASTP